jgi:hypothetical protein
VFNLGKFAAGAALTAGGMGLFGGGAAAATGAAKGAEAATKMADPALKAAAAASRYTPWMTAVGETLMGIPGSPFTGQVMREKYPDLYKPPQYPDFSGTGNFEEDLMKFLANRRRQIVGQ